MSNIFSIIQVAENPNIPFETKNKLLQSIGQKLMFKLSDFSYDIRLFRSDINILVMELTKNKENILQKIQKISFDDALIERRMVAELLSIEGY